MDTTKPILILGSGNSIPFLNSKYYRTGCGLPLKLQEIIHYNYSIGLNYFFKYGCSTTLTSFADWQWYRDNSEEIKKIPLIIGCLDPSLKCHKRDITHPNTILIKKSNAYQGENSITLGCYNRQLVGIWALSLARGLGFKEIYTLGFDCCEINGQTHFYQGVIDINKSIPIHLKGKKVHDSLFFRGVGKYENGKYKTSTYERSDNINKIWFRPFPKDKNCKIYNVSLDSTIEVFEKITYDEFYKKVKNNHINQSEARKEIRKFIEGKLNE